MASPGGSPGATALSSASGDPVVKRRRLPGVSIRPGSVRAARQEAGLSLAQLGRGHVTAPAIYLVETGRTRPSMPTLEHIAKRTNKPVEFFLADPESGSDESQASLAILEAHVARGLIDEAIALGNSLVSAGPSVHRLGRIRFLLGLAHLQRADLVEAGSMLGQALGHFEAVRDAMMIAECLGAQAMLANLSHNSQGVALAERALEACRSLQPTPSPVEARLLEVLGHALVESREWDRAVASLEQSVAVAEPLNSAPAAAAMYGAMSQAYEASAQVEMAHRFATRAAVIEEYASGQASRERCLRTLEIIRSTRSDAGAPGFGGVRRDRVDQSDDDYAPLSGFVLLRLAELSLEAEQTDQAERLVQRALVRSKTTGDQRGVAESHLLLAKLAELQGDHASSDSEFELAIAGLEQLGLRERLLQAHGEYAEALERRGELSRAYAHMKKAVQASRSDMPVLIDTEERAGSA